MKLLSLVVVSLLVSCCLAGPGKGGPFKKKSKHNYGYDTDYNDNDNVGYNDYKSGYTQNDYGDYKNDNTDYGSHSYQTYESEQTGYNPPAYGTPSSNNYQSYQTYEPESYQTYEPEMTEYHPPVYDTPSSNNYQSYQTYEPEMTEYYPPVYDTPSPNTYQNYQTYEPEYNQSSNYYKKNDYDGHNRYGKHGKHGKNGKNGGACYLSNWYSPPYVLSAGITRPLGGPFVWASSVARNTDSNGRVGSIVDGMGILNAYNSDQGANMNQFAFAWVNGADYCFGTDGSTLNYVPPQDPATGQYWEMNFDPPLRVVAVGTQGRPGDGFQNAAQWATNYKVGLLPASGGPEIIYDNDSVDGLPGNTDGDSIVVNSLDNSELISRLRIYLVTLRYNVFPALRSAVRVLSCSNDPEPEATLAEITSQNGFENGYASVSPFGPPTKGSAPNYRYDPIDGSPGDPRPASFSCCTGTTVGDQNTCEAPYSPPINT